MKFDEINVGDIATIRSGKNFLVVDKFEKNKEVLLAVPEEYGGWVHPNTVYRKPSLWVYYADIVATTNNSGGGGKSSSNSNSDIKIGDKVKITNKNALFPCIDSIRAKELMHMEHTVLSLKDNGNTVIIYMPRADGGHTYFSKEYGRAISRSDLMKVENSVKLKTETETKIKIGDKVKVSASAEIPHKIASSPLLKAEFLSREHEVIEVFPTFLYRKNRIGSERRRTFY